MIMADGIFLDNELWFWNAERKGLCSWNFSKEVIGVKCFDTTFPGYKVFSYGNKIYVTAQKKEKIFIYDRLTEEINVVGLQEETTEQRIYFPVQRESCVFLIPTMLMQQEIICFDMRTEKFTIKPELMCQLKQIQTNIQKEALFVFPSVYEGKLWGAIAYTNYYYSYHLMTGEFHLYQSECSNSLWTVNNVKGTLYMTQTDSFNLVVKREEKEGVINICHKGTNVREPYSCIIALKKYLVVLARRGRTIVVLNAETMEKKEICLYEEDGVDYKGSRTVFCAEDDKKIYILPWLVKEVYSIDKQTWEIEKPKIVYDVKQYSVAQGRRLFERQEKTITENSDMSLKHFCYYIAKKKRMEE